MNAVFVICAGPAVVASQPDAASQSRRRLRPDQLHRISYVQNVVEPPASGPKRRNVESETRRPAASDEETVSKSAAGSDDASLNITDAAAAAGDNLGYESSLSPCAEVTTTPTSCLV